MNILGLLVLILLIPIAILVAYLVLSSYLGDCIRARLSGSRIQEGWRGATTTTYARNMMAQGGYEQMELQDLMDKDVPSHEDEEGEGPVRLRGFATA